MNLCVTYKKLFVDFTRDVLVHVVCPLCGDRKLFAVVLRALHRCGLKIKLKNRWRSVKARSFSYHGIFSSSFSQWKGLVTAASLVWVKGWHVTTTAAQSVSAEPEKTHTRNLQHTGH